jgi:glycosyltransferase involved in cell wall biosynthesis
VLSLVTTEDASFYERQVESLERLGVDVETLPVPGDHHDGERKRSVADYLRLARSVRSQSLERYDLVHANYGLTAPAALAQRRLPVVVSLWGSDLKGTFGSVSRACARLADATIVMSEGMATALGTDVAVVPHGVELDRFRPMPQADALDQVGWDADARHVLFPYPRERAVKNYPVAERVVAAADDRLDSPVELHVGEGEIPHDEMPTYMNAADALVLPSDREGSPNVVKEALACNLPVVATPVGDVPERLDGVEPSPVCSSEATLIDGLTDVLRRGERSNGRDAVRDLGLDAMGRNVLEVYRRVTSS